MLSLVAEGEVVGLKNKKEKEPEKNNSLFTSSLANSGAISSDFEFLFVPPNSPVMYLAFKRH